jgi:hypothetical protein
MDNLVKNVINLYNGAGASMARTEVMGFTGAHAPAMKGIDALMKKGETLGMRTYPGAHACGNVGSI